MRRTVVLVSAQQPAPQNLAIYRSLVRTYPERDRRQLLLDLIKTRGDKGQMVCRYIALECAALHNADPSTLVRAARDFCGKEPKFAATVALLAVTHFLTGGGYDPPVSDVNEAVKHLFAAARQIGAVGWAQQELGRLAASPCIPGRWFRQPSEHQWQETRKPEADKNQERGCN